MPRERFWTFLSPKTAASIRTQAAADDVSPGEVISKIVEDHQKNLKVLSALATLYREVRSCRITADILAEKSIGDEGWNGCRDAIEDKVADEVERLFR